MLGEKCIRDNRVYLHQTLILFFSVSSLAYLQVKICDYFFLLVWKIERETCFQHCWVSELVVMPVSHRNKSSNYFHEYLHPQSSK